jgi:hypothetical protein
MADLIPGGKADGKTDRDFSAAQLGLGSKVELEHTNDPAKAREIARDHLTEIPDYYSRLKKMEDAAPKTAGILQSAGRLVATSTDDVVLAYLAHKRHEKGEHKLHMHPPQEGAGAHYRRQAFMNMKTAGYEYCLSVFGRIQRS